MNLFEAIKGVLKSTKEPTKAFVVNPIINEVKLEKKSQMNMFTILKAIYEIIKQIELAFPDSPGVQKFDAAMERLNTEAGAFIADKLPLVQKLINSAVLVLNILGTFRKKSDSPAG